MVKKNKKNPQQIRPMRCRLSINRTKSKLGTLLTYIVRPKQEFRHCKPFVIHDQNLICVYHVARLTNATTLIRWQVRKYVFLNYRIILRIQPGLYTLVEITLVQKKREESFSFGNKRLPACFDILFVISWYKATWLLDLVHDVGFIHHVPLTKWNEFFELIR